MTIQISFFYPSVIKNKYLEYEANAGPVLMITTTAATAAAAVSKMYSEAAEIEFKSVSYRKDICRSKF